MSGQKFHVSPSKRKTVNPSTPAQFSVVNRAQDGHEWSASSTGDETHIDVFGDDDEWGRQLV